MVVLWPNGSPPMLPKCNDASPADTTAETTPRYRASELISPCRIRGGYRLHHEASLPRHLRDAASGDERPNVRGWPTAIRNPARRRSRTATATSNCSGRCRRKDVEAWRHPGHHSARSHTRRRCETPQHRAGNRKAKRSCQPRNTTRRPAIGCGLVDDPLRARAGKTTAFASRDKLLGQQIAEPVGAFDRPRPCRERFRPRHQPRRLGSTRPHRHLSEFVFVVADGNHMMGCLVRIDANDHISQPPPSGSHSLLGNRGGHSYLQTFVLDPLSSHTTARSPPGGTSIDSQTNGWQALSEQPDDDLTTLRNSRRATRSLKQALEGRGYTGDLGALCDGRP